jgi:hypothetical protein
MTLVLSEPSVRGGITKVQLEPGAQGSKQSPAFLPFEPSLQPG